MDWKKVGSVPSRIQCNPTFFLRNIIKEIRNPFLSRVRESNKDSTLFILFLQKWNFPNTEDKNNRLNEVLKLIKKLLTATSTMEPRDFRKGYTLVNPLTGYAIVLEF